MADMFRTFALCALLLVGFSGCLGGNGSTDDVLIPSASDSLPISSPNPSVNNTTVNLNPFHEHDYWNKRSTVPLLDNLTLRLGEDPSKESRTATGSPNVVIIGINSFNLESDGSDDPDSGEESDTVYQGTKEIRFTFYWATTDVKGLTFYYRTAAGSSYNPYETRIQANREYVLTFPEKGKWADMAHQRELSRWAFRIEAYDPDQATNQVAQVHVAKGEVKVSMTMVNGGKQFIDEPHPLFYTHGPVRLAHDQNFTSLEAQSVRVSQAGTTVEKSLGDDLVGWKINGLIPYETTKIRVALYWNYTGQLASATAVTHKLRLLYTDAATDLAVQGPTTCAPAAVTAGPNYEICEFAIDEIQQDSPYRIPGQSDWRFGVRLVMADHEEAAEFQGNVRLVVHTFKE